MIPLCPLEDGSLDYIEQTEWTISNGKPIDFIGRVENFTPHECITTKIKLSML